MRMCVRSTRSPEKWIRRCLPVDVDALDRASGHRRVVMDAVRAPAAWTRRRSTCFPASARWSVRAARNIVSPSGIRPAPMPAAIPKSRSAGPAEERRRADGFSHLEAHCGGVEAGVDQERREWMIAQSRPLISVIKREPLRPRRRAIAASRRANARAIVVRPGSSSGMKTSNWRPPRAT